MPNQLTFGYHIVCQCQTQAMSTVDRRRRAKELRDAKKRGLPPPPLRRGLDCGWCGGKGYVDAR